MISSHNNVSWFGQRVNQENKERYVKVGISVVISFVTSFLIFYPTAAEKMSENLYIIGNEPTLACYRIQEHVHKSGPMIIDKGVSKLHDLGY